MRLQVTTGANQVVFEAPLGDVAFDVRTATVLLTAGDIRTGVQCSIPPSEIYVRDGLFRVYFGTESQAHDFVIGFKTSSAFAAERSTRMLD